MTAAHAKMARLEAQVASQLARINVLSAALRNCNAPACPVDHFAHTYQHPELGELECHLYGEGGDSSTGFDDLVELRAAYLRGVDIAYRLTNDEAARIEIDATAAAAVSDCEMEFA